MIIDEGHLMGLEQQLETIKTMTTGALERIKALKRSHYAREMHKDLEARYKDEYTRIQMDLLQGNCTKIDAIKRLRELSSYGLKESKDVVEYWTL